jgi:hypothetical protein
MVACALSLRQGLAVRIGSRETSEVPAFTKSLLVTKKRVTDLFPPIGIDAGAGFDAAGALPAPVWGSFFSSHPDRTNATVSAQLSRRDASSFPNSFMSPHCALSWQLG